MKPIYAFLFGLFVCGCILGEMKPPQPRKYFSPDIAATSENERQRIRWSLYKRQNDFQTDCQPDTTPGDNNPFH